MRSRTAEWFECKIRYEKLQEDGMQKKVTEVYTVDALSFTEAEKRIMEEMSCFISGAFEVADINMQAYMQARSLTSNRQHIRRYSSATLTLPTSGIRPNCSLSPSTKKQTRRSALA